ILDLQGEVVDGDGIGAEPFGDVVVGHRRQPRLQPRSRGKCGEAKASELGGALWQRNSEPNRWAASCGRPRSWRPTKRTRLAAWSWPRCARSKTTSSCGSSI